MRPGAGGGPTWSSPRRDAAPGADELLRWRQTSTDSSALPARAADLADAARDVPALPPGTLTRIYANVTGGEGVARRSERLRGVPLGLRLAMLVTLLLVSAATAKGAMLLWQRYVAPAGPSAPGPGGAAPRTRIASRGSRAQPRVGAVRPSEPAEELAEDPDESPLPAEAPPPEVEALGAPAPSRVPAPSRALRAAATSSRARRGHTPAVDRTATATSFGAAAAGAAGDAPANEAQLLADALRRLRQAHDPRGALAVLDRYDATYPGGVLAGEARSARLEATLNLGDRPGALALLDGGAAFAGRLGAEQLLTRAELRASVGRYADALADFNRLLAPAAAMTAPPPATLERALYGRAVTLGHLGRDDRARADLEGYRRRFPTGRYAGEVTRLLAGAPADQSSSSSSSSPRL